MSFYYNRLKFCGCGCPVDTLKFLKGFLNKYSKTQNDMWEADRKDRSMYHDLHQLGKLSSFGMNISSGDKNIQDGVIDFVMYSLDNIGVLEHGGSIGGAWLTDYGKEVVDSLNKLTDDELEMAMEEY